MGSGPWDIEQVEHDNTRLDLGSILIPNQRHADVRVELDVNTHQPTKVSVELKESIVTIQAFAAPTREDLWPQIRDDIERELAAQGVQSTIVMGKFGTEIRAVMPTIDFDGSNVVQSVRFLGFDGPRWFLRCVVTGAGAVDSKGAKEVDDFIAQLVVRRGETAMGPGEALQISLPDEA
ncbi:MAG: DUF3710 domain-containing protein [Actinomycetes bacterium]